MSGRGSDRVIVGGTDERALVYDVERMSLATAPRAAFERALRYAQLGHGELELEPADLELWRQVDGALAHARPVQPLATPAVVTKLALGNTYHCNMGCSYCYNELDIKDRKGSAVPGGMSAATARASIDALIEQSGDVTDLAVVFVGGEPLLEKAVMYDAVSHAHRRGDAAGKRFSFAVYTNGTLMNQEVIDWAAGNSVSLVVSLDGPPAVHDAKRVYLSGRPTSRIVLRNIRRLVESATQSPLRVRAVADSGTTLVALHRYLLDLGFNEIHVQPAYSEAGIDDGGNQDEMIALLGWYHERLLEGRAISVMPFEGFLERMLLHGTATASWYPCSAGRNFLGIGPDGKVYPCHHFLEEGRFELGDVRVGLPILAQREPFFQRVDEREPCRSCWARHACGGECYHRAHTAGAGYTGTVPDVCRRRKSLIGLTLEVLADLSVRRRDVLSALVRKQYTCVEPRWQAYEASDLSGYAT